MKKISLIIILTLIVTYGAIGSIRAAEEPVEWQQSTEVDLPNPECVGESVTIDDLTMEYIVQMPRVRGDQDFEKGAPVKYPVLLMLHGSGGEGTLVHYKDQEQEWPILLDHSRRSYEFPFIMIAPLKPTSVAGGWDPLKAHVMQALDNVIEKYSVDNERIYICGFSMGGRGTFSYAADFPTRFAAGIVGAGNIDISKAAKLTNFPLWVIHGTTDYVVPFENARKVTDLLQGWGAEVLITELPLAHELTSEMFSETTFNWLLKHKITPKTTAPNKPFVDPIENTDTFVSGEAFGDLGTKVTVKVNGNLIGEDEVGNDELFKVSIPKQKAGTIVEVTLTDVWGNVSEASTRKVKKDTKPPTVKVTKVTVKRIKGKTEANATVTVMRGKKRVARVKVGKSGKFNIKLKKIKKGQTIKVFGVDQAGNKSKAKKYKIK